MDVGQAYLAWVFPTAGRDELDEICALEVAASILGDGMASRLYRRLIDELRLVTMVSAWTYGLTRIGLLGIDAVCAPGRRGAVEAEVASVLDAAVEHGVSEKEVRRAQAMLAADFAYDNETSASLTGTMGEFEVLYGGAERYREVLAGIARVTPDDVGAVLARRARPERGILVSVSPDVT
jgi:predicted Zn-dependent peptidase